MCLPIPCIALRGLPTLVHYGGGLRTSCGWLNSLSSYSSQIWSPARDPSFRNLTSWDISKKLNLHSQCSSKSLGQDGSPTPYKSLFNAFSRRLAGSLNQRWLYVQVWQILNSNPANQTQILPTMNFTDSYKKAKVGLDFSQWFYIQLVWAKTLQCS